MNEQATERRHRLLTAMERRGMAAIVIPTADEHLSEYVAAHWKTREALSGFTGSNGTLAVVTSMGSTDGKEHWALWTDSRYFLQAKEQLAGTDIQLMKENVEGTPTVERWIVERTTAESKVCLPLSLMSVRAFLSARRELNGRHIDTSLYDTLVDEAWTDRPSKPNGTVREYDTRYAGESRESKMVRVRQWMSGKGVDAVLTCALDEVAWLLNLRGSDEPYTPVFDGCVLLTATEYTLYTNHRLAAGVVGKPTSAMRQDLASWQGGKIALDMRKTPAAVREMVGGEEKIRYERSVIEDMKAIRNETERNDIRQTMEVDGVALIRHWKWMEETTEPLTERSVAEKLHAERRRAGGALYQGESFETIAGWKSHGAIVHYAATAATDARIEGDGLLLMDSGGQYLTGTTDVTRTFTHGTVDEETKHDFTLVLKGHIALARACFPYGTTGARLEPIARQFLWAERKNYGHGTGHGVGHYLCVHEGPQRIGSKGTVALRANMVTSNEPGYYREGHYGIRHESLTLTVEDRQEGWLRFETLTLCPFDAKGVDFTLLTTEEKAWLRQYHEEIFRRLSMRLTAEERSWLETKCQPFF